MTLIMSHAVKTKLDQWLQKFPVNQKQSAVLYALQLVQAENGGWLTEAHMDMVASYLSMPKIAVYEVASFYTLYDLKPVGRHKISVCTNISCMLKGSDHIVDHIKRKLNIEIGETTEDGKFTLKSVECLAACGVAPMMQIGSQYYENLTPERVDAILEELK